MKKELVYAIFKMIKSNKEFKEKIKIFLAVVIVGVFTTSAITVWFGFKAFNYVATKTKEVGQTLVVNCWGKVQSLIGIQVWIERSVIDHIIELKTACLDNNSSSTQNFNGLKNQVINQ